MSRKVKIKLRWLVNAPAGQSPRGQNFTRPARFQHQGDDWKREAWSLAINTEGVPNDQGEQSASANFLMANAPHDWLSVGNLFTLYENVPLAEAVVEQILPD